MTKYELALRQAEITKSVTQKLFLAQGLDETGAYDSQNDKAELSLKYSGHHSFPWNEASCQLHASHGFYGSSSGYSDMDGNVAKYLVQAINNSMPQIARQAIALADADLRKAKEDAKSEALSVLDEHKMSV